MIKFRSDRAGKEHSGEFKSDRTQNGYFERREIMELKTIGEFRSSMQQLPALQAIHQKDQQRFLIDAYKLAKQKYKYQQWMEGTGKVAKSIRASSTGKLYRCAKHIWNALADIEKAKKAVSASSPKLMRNLQVIEAADLLRGAYDDLGFLIAMDIAAIAPRHRSDMEKEHRAIYPHKLLSRFEEKFSGMPQGQAEARLNYLLAAALSSCLVRCRPSTGKSIRPIQRHRIISGVFTSALGQIYPKATVKTALYRTS